VNDLVEAPPTMFLDRLFLEHVGNYQMIDKTTMLSMKIAQPPKEHPDIEVSQLRDFCWRVEIYPSADPHGVEYGGKMRFCVTNRKDHLIVWKYRYLLETRELGQTNKE
jgi:hypothetical protein